MTTLIAAYDSQGRCIGRCDAKCYDADHPDCDCLCGGRNHGAGRQKATENTRQFFEDFIDAWEKLHPEAEKFTTPALKPVQLGLFDKPDRQSEMIA